MKTRTVVIVGGARTPMCEYSGTPGLRQVQGPRARSTSARTPRKAALARAKVDPRAIEHVVVGNALQTSIDALYGARHVGLKAGVPKDDAGADRQPPVRLGHPVDRQRRADDPARRGDDGARRRHGEHEPGAATCCTARAQGFRFGSAAAARGHRSSAALMDPLAGLFMAQTAENVAKRLAITRAAAGRVRAAQPPARRRGGQGGPLRRGDRAGRGQDAEGRARSSTTDDHIKPDTTLEALAEAAPGLRQGRHGHRRQRQRHRRRRRRASC